MYLIHLFITAEIQSSLSDGNRITVNFCYLKGFLYFSLEGVSKHNSLKKRTFIEVNESIEAIQLANQIVFIKVQA